MIRKSAQVRGDGTQTCGFWWTNLRCRWPKGGQRPVISRVRLRLLPEDNDVWCQAYFESRYSTMVAAWHHMVLFSLFILLTVCPFIQSPECWILEDLLAEMNTIFINMFLICAGPPKTDLQKKNCCVFVTWEWAFYMCRGSRPSLTESVKLRHHVSTIAQYGQLSGHWVKWALFRRFYKVLHTWPLIISIQNGKYGRRSAIRFLLSSKKT